MTHIINSGVLLLALALSLLAVAAFHRQTMPSAARAETATTSSDYRRIVSLGIVSDAALAELCEPDRVVGVSAWSTGPTARRWAGKPRLRGLDDLEAVIALRPDLVLLSTDGSDLDRLERLRAVGIQVVALGAMRGAASYTADVLLVGTLLGRADEARVAGQRLHERLARVADQTRLPPLALYVATYGETLFGGTVGTSYHDVLIAAGCRDAAAGHYTDWPQYGIEHVVALQPEIIVTKRGMAARLWALPGMAALVHTRIIELDGELLEDPGPRLLEAAEALRDAWLALPPRALPAVNPGTATSR